MVVKKMRPLGHEGPILRRTEPRRCDGPLCRNAANADPPCRCGRPRKWGCQGTTSSCSKLRRRIRVGGMPQAVADPGECKHEARNEASWDQGCPSVGRGREAVFLDDVAPEGMGIWAPTPKKLNPASIKIAAAKLAAHTTTNGPSALGAQPHPPGRQPQGLCSAHVSLLPQRQELAPHVRATSTHRQSDGRKTCQNPLPNANVMANTINSVGTDHMTWRNHEMSRSAQPPK